MKGHWETLPLVRAAGLGDLPDMVERQAGERVLVELFQKAGLPLALRDAPATPMPLAAMAGLFDRAAQVLENRTLGLDVGERMSHRGYGLWVAYAAGGATLGEGLERVVATQWAHCYGTSLQMVDTNGHKVLRFCTPPAETSKIQHSDHVLPPMRSFVRLYLGPRWAPDWVEVDYARDAAADRAEEWLQAPLHCGRSGTGIAVRAEDLAQRRQVKMQDKVRIVTLRDVLADVVLAAAPEPARALSAVVALRLLDGRSDIEGAAEMVGLSVQGLQRRLREKGYTYREVVDAGRCARAIRLLVETRMSVIEIALCLGYETHPAFTRAFVRWTGCTPLDYRRRQTGRT